MKIKIDNPNTEEVVKIKGYRGSYGVTKDGRIFTFKHGQSREMCQYPINGYRRVFLFKNNKDKPILVHRLVALHFLPLIRNKKLVNHKDGNKRNNNVENLEWCTLKENQKHSREVLGNTQRGSKNPNYGNFFSKVYPNRELRNELIELGVPYKKHNFLELSEILPHRIERENLLIEKIYNGWSVMYRSPVGSDTLANTFDETLPNAMAKMVCWLVKQGLLKF